MDLAVFGLCSSTSDHKEQTVIGAVGDSWHVCVSMYKCMTGVSMRSWEQGCACGPSYLTIEVGE